MQSESSLDRSLWTIALAIAVALVVANFAQRPLFGGDGEASGFGHPITLWVTGGEAASQVRSIARQVAACWEQGGQQVDVGVLPGGSSTAVVDFLRSSRRSPDELLLVTSDTLAEVARDERSTPGSELRERGEIAARLLSTAPTVSVLGSDSLALAVSARSPLRDTSQLLAQLRGRPAQPFIGIAEDAWLEGSLASLALRAGVERQVPFEAYRSSRLALASLVSGEIGAVLTQRSSLAADLAAGRVRALPWPHGHEPRSQVALLAPLGLTGRQLATLQSQSGELCAGGEWRRMLHSDGISPIRSSGTTAMRSFVAEDMAEAAALQALAERIVRSY
ncbi:MAG TPA: LysR substrate-binding domain-containing protein [Solirubrobacteraceae bacterium]|nr:LysR substrate-binding domain-containing protein [Solirubrobacteraceae bacterium]